MKLLSLKNGQSIFIYIEKRILSLIKSSYKLAKIRIFKNSFNPPEFKDLDFVIFFYLNKKYRTLFFRFRVRYKYFDKIM